MRKLISIAMVLVMVLAFAVPTMAATTFKTINLNFEDESMLPASVVDLATGVKTWHNAGFSHSTEKASSGEKSMAIDAAKIDGSFSIWFEEPASNVLTAGTEYIYAFRVNTQNLTYQAGGKYWASGHNMADDNAETGLTVIEKIEAGENWKWFIFNIKPDSQDLAKERNLAFACLGEGAAPSGTIYIDDMLFGLKSDVTALMKKIDEKGNLDNDDDDNDAVFDMITLDYEKDKDADKAYLESKGVTSFWYHDFVHSSAQAYTGKQSLLLDTAQAVGYSFSYAANKSKIVPDVEYTFAAKVKTVNHAPAGLNWQLAMYVEGSAPSAQKFKTGNNDWEWVVVKRKFTQADLEKNITLTFDKAHDETIPILERDTKGLIYIDDLVFGLSKDVKNFMKDKDDSRTTTTTGGTTTAKGDNKNPANGEKSNLPIMLVIAGTLVAFAVIVSSKKSKKSN